MFLYLAISGLMSMSTWVLVLLPIFLHDRGWSSQRIGWAVGLYFLFNLVVQVVAGPLADRLGYVRTALAGSLVAFVGGLLYLFCLGMPSLVFPARILHAAGVALISAGAMIQLIQSVPLRLRGRMMGYFGLPGFIMMGLGPLLAEWLVYRWDFRAMFLSLPVLFIAIGWFVWRLPRLENRQSADRQIPFLQALHASFIPLRAILLFSVVFGFCFSAWNSFIAPAVYHGVGAGGVSAYGIGYGVGAVLTRLGFSHRLDQGAARFVSISTLAFYGVALAWIPHAATTQVLMALGLVCGMAHGTYYPSLSSVAAERFHPLHAGQGMSLYLSASALGMFVGPPIWGTLADSAGFGPMFLTAGLTMTAGTIVFVATQSRARRTPPHGGSGVLDHN